MRILRAISVCAVLSSAAAFADPAPAAAPDKFGLDASRVTIRAKEAGLGEILLALARQSGNACLELPDNWEAKGVTFEAVDAPYWQTLDRLDAQLGLASILRIVGAKIEPALVDGKGHENVAAYSGPLVVRLAGVRERNRSAEAGSHGLEMSLAWFCEDRLHPLETKASVTKITGSDGKDLVFAAAQGEPPVEGWPPRAVERAVVVNGKVHQVPDVSAVTKPPPATNAGTVVAKIDAVPLKMQGLKSVEGTVRLTLGLGRKDLKIQDVLGGKNTTAEAGEDKVVVTQARRGTNSINLAIRCTSNGSRVDLRTLDAMAPYGVRLVAADGTQVETTILKRKSALAAPEGGEGQAAVVPPEEEDDFIAAFVNPPNIEGAWTLVVTVPETRATKDFAFKLSDVPLP